MSKPVRNPLRSEADAFRLLIIVLAAGALVIAVAVLISGVAAAALALVLLAVAMVRAFNLFRQWHREGSDPYE